LDVPLGLRAKHPFHTSYAIGWRRSKTCATARTRHQQAAFYRLLDAAEHTLARAEQLQGKELSHNNILDTDACWSAVREFDEPACVIVKHTNPCGTAVGADIVEAYTRAHAADPVSAIWRSDGVNRTVSAALVQASSTTSSSWRS